jgi:hypothetical protein
VHEIRGGHCLQNAKTPLETSVTCVAGVLFLKVKCVAGDSFFPACLSDVRCRRQRAGVGDCDRDEGGLGKGMIFF